MAEEGFPIHPVASHLWKAGAGALQGGNSIVKSDFLRDGMRFGGDVSGPSPILMKIAVVVGLTLKIPKMTIF